MGLGFARLEHELLIVGVGRVEDQRARQHAAHLARVRVGVGVRGWGEGLAHQLESETVGDDGGVAVRDVGEGAAVH